MARWKRGDRDTVSWIILIVGAAFIVLCAMIGAAFADLTDDQEAELAFQCKQKVWELLLPDDSVIAGEMEEGECKELRGALQPIKPFIPLQCKWKYACRQEL